MAKPKNIIITEDGVITQEALVAYAEGRLSAEETVRIEKVLQDDPFAQDALEGIRSAAAPAEMKSVITSLNMQLREKTGARESKKKGIEIHWATYAYAAMIVGILIGLGFVMVHFISERDQSIAMNKPVTQADESGSLTEQKPEMIPDTTQLAPGTTPVTVNDSESVSLNDVSTAPGTYTTTAPGRDGKNMAGQTQAPPAAAPAVADKKVAPAKPEATKSVTINGGRADETQYVVNGHRVIGESKSAKEEEKKKAADDAAATGSKAAAKIAETAKTEVQQSEKDIQTKKLSKEDTKSKPAPVDNLKAARALFDAGDFKEAGKAYSKILSDQPDNSDALYFGGICEFRNGKNRQAEKSFDKLIKSNQYVDGSKWYKANVLIERGKKDEAKQLLRDLINTNSHYKDRAVKKYEEIVK